MSLIEVWKNRGKITEGITNKIFKKEHVEEIFNERMEICKSCPDLDEEGSKCYVPGTQPCCGCCGCSLGLKLRSLSSGCGNEDDPKWDPVLNEVEEEMLEDLMRFNDGGGEEP